MEGTEKLSEIIWIAPEDFKTAMIVLRNAWKYSGQETYAEAEELEEDEIDYEDDEYYAVVEYYDHEDGSSAEVYYSDEEKKEISDIRFWMVIDEDERERFYSACRELHPEWDPDEEDGVLAAIMDPYKAYLYQKALNRV